MRRKNVNQLEAWQRQLDALHLRQQGLTYEQIANAIGYADASGAYRAVEKALIKTLQEPADAVRRMEKERLDKMLAAIWPKVEAGDLKAIETALKIQERRAKYDGLDAPKSIDVTSQGDRVGVVAIEAVAPNDTSQAR